MEKSQNFTWKCEDSYGELGDKKCSFVGQYEAESHILDSG